MPAPLDLDHVLFEAERDCLLEALAHSHGLITTAAELMGISKQSTYRLIHKHGLKIRRVGIVVLPEPSLPGNGTVAVPEETPDAPL